MRDALIIARENECQKLYSYEEQVWEIECIIACGSSIIITMSSKLWVWIIYLIFNLHLARAVTVHRQIFERHRSEKVELIISRYIQIGRIYIE